MNRESGPGSTGFVPGIYGWKSTCQVYIPLFFRAERRGYGIAPMAGAHMMS